jgi:hypothetical protein
VDQSLAKEVDLFEKDAYIKRQEQHLDEWKKKIKELRTAAENARSIERARCNRLIADLHLKLRNVEERIVELKISDDSSAVRLQSSVDEAWTVLFRCFSDAAAVIM